MATIKSLSLLALIALMMVGCGEQKTHQKVYESNCGWRYTIYEIDSCEYINGGNQLAHKGNCRFCAERRKEELQELVNELKGE